MTNVWTSAPEAAAEFAGRLEPGRFVLVFTPGLDSLTSDLEVPVKRSDEF